MNCNIQKVGKYRNGKDKYFCSVHKCFLKELKNICGCQKYKYVKVFDIDISIYKSIGIWGFLKPIFDTTNINNVDCGVHLHLRRKDNEEKIIDDTFDKLIIKNGEEYIGAIECDKAKAYTLTKTAGFSVDKIYCKHCGAIHTDTNYLAVYPHKKHLCFNCGREFFNKKRNISNEIIEIVEKIEKYHTRKYIKSKKKSNINLKDFKGGIKIWASNPAILWTLQRAEEEGIHIHCYDKDGKKLIDDTFGEVYINGVRLDYLEVRLYMAQVNIPQINKKIISAKCKRCNTPLFSKKEKAFIPSTKFICQKCNYENKFKRKYIFNPIVDKLNYIYSKSI